VSVLGSSWFFGYVSSSLISRFFPGDGRKRIFITLLYLFFFFFLLKTIFLPPSPFFCFFAEFDCFFFPRVELLGGPAFAVCPDFKESSFFFFFFFLGVMVSPRFGHPPRPLTAGPFLNIGFELPAPPVAWTPPPPSQLHFERNPWHFFFPFRCLFIDHVT